MKQKTVAFCTLGCKVNQYETNAMMQKFMKSEYKIVEFDEVSDIYVINTCTVTNIADKKSRQMIRRVKELNSESILIVTGCYAQVAKDKLEQIPEIDLILGVNEKNAIVDYVENLLSKREIRNVHVSDIAKQEEFLEFGEVTYTEKTRAVIKVQDGCNQFCSYCLIPYARGRVRSRKPEWVISEVTRIAEKGIKEVVLTGIHIASYGKDYTRDTISNSFKYKVEKNEFFLIDLLEEINKVEGIERIRLGSLEPTLITEDFVSRLSKLPKICNQFHLSLQSGCDETLKRMNRKYTTKEFEKGVELLRKAYPEVHLTTDVIVGFPGETDKEFEETYNFLEKIKFYKMHIFKYSKRDGTVASQMSNQIDGSIKEQRSNKLIELSDKNEKEYNRKYIEKTVDVLLEDREGEYIKGHTKNYMVVKVRTDKDLENTIQKVNVNGMEDLELVGNLK